MPSPKLSALRPIALVLLVALTTTASADLAGGNAFQASPSGASSATPLIDGGWPRAYTTPAGGRMVIYQPQMSQWTNQRHMVVYAAVSYAAPGSERAALGTVKAEADTTVAVSDRLVRFTPFRITETNISTLTRNQVQEVVAEINEVLPDDERVIALDRVLAAVDRSQILSRNVEGVKADPPTVFFSQSPAILVNFDGDPIWSPIQGSELRYAVNTNWDLFEHSSSKTYFLRHERVWLKAVDISGPWAPAGALPPAFSQLPADQNWAEIRSAIPGRSIPASQAPRVFVTFQPAELMLLRGAPAYQAVRGTGLHWVSNTGADLFRMGKSGAVYYLVAGRWFSAPDFTGPWTFATPQLPADFARIPVDHERSRVLASVPGTPQAAEAVLLAQIPQTARVNKKELKAPEVSYQGSPQFVTVDPTTVARAVNTDKDVLRVGDLYYLCFQGVWFVSRDATGPWEVASTIPASIYQIPPSSPVHHVTYVTVEDDDDTDVHVTFIAAPAYTGMMVAWGCAVWGTGWYYPPYVWYGGPHPIYYPHFPTYGYAAWYNPWTGTYGRSAVAYGPYGGAGVTARYNPSTGTYARGAAAYGPYGAAGFAQAYNPRTGTYAQTRQAANVYGSWGSTYVQRGDDWARTNRYTSNVTGATTRTIQTDEGGAVTRRGMAGGGFVAGSESGDVYAGHDGSVYKREGDGSWHKYEDGSWTAVESPARRAGAAPATRVAPTTLEQLGRDSAARREGAVRTRAYGTYRSGSGTRDTGSYRSRSRDSRRP